MRQPFVVFRLVAAVWNLIAGVYFRRPARSRQSKPRSFRTICYGVRPRQEYRGVAGLWGTLSILDGTLDFQTPSGAGSFTLPVDALRWLGFRTIPVYDVTHNTRSIRALFLHLDTPNGWYTVVLGEGQTPALAEYVSALCDLPLHDVGTESESHGPEAAVCLTQDIYGAWHQGAKADVFLTPDRLLIDGRDSIPLAHVRCLGAVAPGSLNPFARELLRVESCAPDSAPVVAGFLVRDAARWAAVIAAHSGRPIPVDTGRKKKA